MMSRNVVLEFSAASEQIYFGSALLAANLAKATAETIRNEDGLLSASRLCAYIEMDNCGDEIDVTREQVREMEAALQRYSELFSTFIQATMNIDVFAVMTLEAHINDIAATELSGMERDMFDRLSLEAKWLFLPKLLAAPAFDASAEPFQGLKRVIKRRNKLVHMKSGIRHHLTRSGADAKEFIEDGLEAADDAIKTVRDLVLQLAKLLGHSDPPPWLSSATFQYCEVRLDTGESPTGPF